MDLGRRHLGELLLREIQVGTKVVRKGDAHSVTDIAYEDRECGVVVSFEVAYTDCPEPNSGPEDQDCYACI